MFCDAAEGKEMARKGGSGGCGGSEALEGNREEVRESFGPAAVGNRGVNSRPSRRSESVAGRSAGTSQGRRTLKRF